MPSRSSSTSRQTQTTQNQTNQLALEDFGDNAIIGDGNTVTQTDFGAVAGALDFGNNSLGVVENSLNSALEFAGGAGAAAYEAIENTTDKAFTFVGEGVNKIFGIVGDTNTAMSENTNNVLDFAAGNNVASLDFAGQASNDALTFAAGNNLATLDFAASSQDFAADSQDNAFRFAGENNQAAFDAITGSNTENVNFLENAQNNILGFSRDNVQDTLEFAAGAQIASYGAYENALEFADRRSVESAVSQQNALNQVSSISENARRDSLDFGAGVLGMAIDEISDSAEDTQRLLTEFAGKTIQTAVNSTKSESAQAVDKILDLTGNTQKQLMYAAGGVVLLVLFMRGSK